MEATALAGAKRPREEGAEEPEATAAADQETTISTAAAPPCNGGEPAHKKAKGADQLKVVGAAAGSAADSSQAAAFAEPAAAESTGAAESASMGKVDPPAKIGYRTFNNGNEAFAYFHDLIQHITRNQDLNEYEFHMVLELIKMGHETPEQKLGAGVRAVQVRDHQKYDEWTTCLFLLRVDGSEDDVSARKCVARIFPAWGAARASSFSGKGGSTPRGRGRSMSAQGRDGGRGGSRGRGGGGFRGRGPET
ncbi:hypothetical protein WJX81_004820 [Elliptochloris bilobata]|uniref:Uncharacterized protein n=1 Tax=Elliptochloris bilobata TaxID=381761 RepID=A0AAW1QZB5_9CHLO